MICCRRRRWNLTNTVPMVDNDTSSKIGVGSFNKLLPSGAELNFQKLPTDNCIHVDPQNFLWVNIEIIDPLVPKDISRRGGLRSLPFSNRWVSYRKWRLREGGGKENQLFIIKCFRGWALVFAGEAGFPALRRLNNREQRTDNSRQIGARNVTFQKSSH